MNALLPLPVATAHQPDDDMGALSAKYGLSSPTGRVRSGANLNWAHAPSPFAWTVLIYGGQNPRTGFEQPNMEAQFHKRTRPHGTGYTAKSIVWRANGYAKGEHRTHFAVRDTDGSILYDGPVLDENEETAVVARLTDEALVAHSRDQRQFNRMNRGGRHG